LQVREFRSRAPGDRPPREGATGERAPGDRPPRDRTPGDRGPGGRGPSDRAAGERAARDRGPGDRGPRGPKKRPFGNDRHAPEARQERKLTSFESIIDRGFEEVADEANEGATKRIDWTIIKRTTADQRTTKPVSTIYVLRRDGAETEFANLAASRAAVNKTIVHPEKLTRAKGDYASTKK
jgi:hypothetical protein